MVGGFSFFVFPFLLVAWHFLAMPADYAWFMLIIVQLVAIILMRSLIDHRFRHPRLYSLSHPVGISFMLVSGVYAAIKRFTGAGVRWKQRLYTPESGIE